MTDKERAQLAAFDRHIAFLRYKRDRCAPRPRTSWDWMVRQDLNGEIAARERDEWQHRTGIREA